MIDNEVVTRIAQKIRATRLEKNLTIQQLATRTHVSKGLLSKIENSRTIPSLPVFVTLIQSLDISLKEFFQDMILMNGKEYRFVKKEQYSKLPQAKANGFNYYQLLSQTIPNCTMKTGVLVIEPGARGKVSTIDGYEFKYLISGRCEFQINNEVLQLEEGDGLYLDGTIPHLSLNKSEQKATMLEINFVLST